MRPRADLPSQDRANVNLPDDMSGQAPIDPTPYYAEAIHNRSSRSQSADTNLSAGAIAKIISNWS